MEIKTALELLNNGQSSKIGDLRLDIDEPGILKVIGWSNYTNFSNLTKQQCQRELKEIKTLFYEMVKAYPELVDCMQYRSLEFHLYFDDYGKGSIGLCSENEKILTWEVDI